MVDERARLCRGPVTGVTTRCSRSGPQPADVRDDRIELGVRQAVAVGRHLHRLPSQEEAGDPVFGEPLRMAMHDPLAYLPVVPRELAEVLAVPGRDVALQRAGIGQAAAPLRPVAAEARQALGGLAPMRRP